MTADRRRRVAKIVKITASRRAARAQHGDTLSDVLAATVVNTVRREDSRPLSIFERGALDPAFVGMGRKGRHIEPDDEDTSVPTALI